MKSLALVWKGLAFGMLLQLAVGPVCLLVLSTAGTLGFLPTLPMVAAVTLTDAFYILMASLGVGAVMGRPKVKKAVKLLGGAVLVLFGLDAVLGALGCIFLPGIRLFSVSPDANQFVKGLVLTLSNPLTILFWGGMFTAKGVENHWIRRQLFFFAIGCVSSTALFLTAVAAAGGALSGRIPEAATQVLNIAVGAALVFFGIRLSVRREKPTAA